MQLVRGMMIPEELTPEELKEMMESGNMQTFMVACEALRLADTPWAYGILKQYITHSDLYKRRYVLSVIFHYPQAAELVPHLERALTSGTSFLEGTALDVIIQDRISVSEERLLTYFERNRESINCYHCLALDTVARSDENARRVLKMFRLCRNKSMRIALAQCLYDFHSEENHLELYELFRKDPVPHIRILACRIARDYHHPELLDGFVQDPDGHIRKLARKP